MSGEVSGRVSGAVSDAVSGGVLGESPGNGPNPAPGQWQARPQDGASSDDEVFVALTAEQAAALRVRQPVLSPWWVVAMQAVLGTVVSLLLVLLSGQLAVGVSAAWGALAVVLPAALFARGVTGRFASVNVGSAVLSFFVWELVKIVMTVGILWIAQRVVEGLRWWAMLLTLVVTMKVYWLALAIRPKAKPVQGASA